MYLATGCAFNFDEMFHNFDKTKLKITSNLCEELVNDRHKNTLILDIFLNSLKLIFYDIIQNNITFELPTGGKKADINVMRVSGEEFKKARQNGAFKDVDILQSWFSGNILSLNLHSNNRTRNKRIYISGRLKELLIENTNKGKLYC